MAKVGPETPMKGIESYLGVPRLTVSNVFNTNGWKEWIVYKSTTDVIKFVKSEQFWTFHLAALLNISSLQTVVIPKQKRLGK